MEFLNGEWLPEHEFSDLPKEINLDVLPEFNLSKIQIGARWFVGEIDRKELAPWIWGSSSSREKAIDKAESKRSRGNKWKLWVAPVLIMDFAHKENLENKFSWISLPNYFKDIFWLSYVSFNGGVLSNRRDELPLKEASFSSVKSFVEGTNNLTSDYIKQTPFEAGKDYISIDSIDSYPIVFNSKSEGTQYKLSWDWAHENAFARGYCFDNEINTNHLLNRFYEAKTQ